MSESGHHLPVPLKELPYGGPTRRHNSWSGREGEEAGTLLSQACINRLLSERYTLPDADVMLVSKSNV